MVSSFAVMGTVESRRRARAAAPACMLQAASARRDGPRSLGEDLYHRMPELERCLNLNFNLVPYKLRETDVLECPLRSTQQSRALGSGAFSLVEMLISFVMFADPAPSSA